MAAAPALDHYRTFGRTGLRVSPFCLGTMTFGDDWGWGSDEATSRSILERYLDAGGNFIDTSNMYTNGHSEVIIGEVLRNRRVRDRVVLATKFGGNLYPGDPNAGGSSRKAIMAAVDQSLRRLQTDYIDLLWAHFWDYFTPIDETVQAMSDLVAQGKVRYLGFSDHPAWVSTQAHMLAKFHGWAPLAGIQVEYSLLERSVETEHLRMAQALGLGVASWSPLKGGWLSGKYGPDKDAGPEARNGAGPKQLDERTARILQALESVGRELDATPAQVALAWVLSHPAVTSPILGARRIQQLEDNLKAAHIRLAPSLRALLDEASAMPMPFPDGVIKDVPDVVLAGATVGGTTSRPWGGAPESDDDRW